MSDIFTIGRRPPVLGTWLSVRLKDVCVYVNRGIAPSYADVDTGFTAVSQKCVLGNGRIDQTLGRPIEDPGVAMAEARLLNGDILVNSTGTAPWDEWDWWKDCRSIQYPSLWRMAT